MLYHATQRIAEAFEEAGLKYQTQEIGPLSLVDTGFTGDNCTYRLRFISMDEDNDVKAMTEDFAKVPESRKAAAYQLLNQLNREYKYLKFTMDDKGAICAQYDFPLSLPDDRLGGVAIEVAVRASKIVDDAYPKIMQTIWS